ncbi:MAG: hypothetical protein ACRCZP_07310 [Phycicoccus sp.]
MSQSSRWDPVREPSPRRGAQSHPTAEQWESALAPAVRLLVFVLLVGLTGWLLGAAAGFGVAVTLLGVWWVLAR